MGVFKYFGPKCTLFGYGCLEGLGQELVSAGYKKALIVTDRSLIELGIVGKVTEVLERYRIEFSVFDGVNPNPDCYDVNNGLSAVKGHHCDFLISIGGGSAHDCAKAVAILAANGGNILDYKGTDQSKVPALPLVAVNTTAGTASECTRAYVIVDKSTNEKFGNRDKHALAAIAVDDHSLMMGLPKSLTAGTGMDALTHAIEAYVSIHGFLMTSSLALAAIKLILKNLEQATLSPDENSREGMAVGQYLAGLAFGNAGCGLVHSMSHQLSAIYDLPHGLCNAILLPEVMRFNCASDTVIKKYAEIAKDNYPLECMDKIEKEQAELLIDKVETLSKTIGTKISLKKLGVKAEDISLLAQKTLQDGSLGNNEVQPSKEQVEVIYRKLMEEIA